MEATTITTCFARVAARWPERVAVRDGETEWTYAGLARETDAIAAGLAAAHGVRPGDRVGVAFPRSAAAVVAMLGVLKAGGVYLPLEPRHPQERNELILADAAPVLVLDDERMAEVVARAPADRGSPPSDHRPGPDSPAYLVYTSGSTGRPKGVLVRHRSVAHLVSATRPLLGYREHDRWTCTHSFAFDLSAWEIWAPLLTGGSVTVVGHDTAGSPEDLLGVLEEDRITVFSQTPSALRRLFRVPGARRPGSLRMVLAGGEALPQYLARDVLAWDVPLWNLYGPTEATVWATAHEVTVDGLDGGPTVPIGSAFGAGTAVVLDPGGQPVPPGEPGELHLGGPGLAAGYWHRPALTERSFVPHPLATEPGRRLYRTGDRVRLGTGGTLEFLGRLDQQVKLGGFRVEPGEVESVLRGHPDLADAVVETFTDDAGESRLIAHVLADRLDEPGLREYLRHRLPPYLVPAAFARHDRFPLTINGKVDREALRRIPERRTAPGGASGARDRLTRIWSKVLFTERFGPHDDFFALGGDSLRLLDLRTLVHDEFGVFLPTEVLRRSRTVARLVEVLAAHRPDGDAVPVARGHAGPVPASFGQQRLFNLQAREPDCRHYQLVQHYLVEGPVSAEILARALDRVVGRHAVLRTHLSLVDDAVVQYVRPAGEAHPVLRRDRVDGADPRAVATGFPEHPLRADDPAGPWRARVTDLGHRALLSFAMHHVVTDDISFDNLIAEMADEYGALTSGGAPPGPLPFQYADHADWQRSYWLSGSGADAREFWTHRLAAWAPVTLRTDRELPERPQGVAWPAGAVVRELPPELVTGALDVARDHGVTAATVGMAITAAAIAPLADHPALPLGTTYHGRDTPGAERLIGFFANPVFLTLRPRRCASFAALLAHTAAEAEQVYAHAGLPLMEVLGAPRDFFGRLMFLHEVMRTPPPLGGSPVSRFVPDGTPTTRTTYLKVVLEERPGAWRLRIVHNTTAFDEPTVADLADAMVDLLDFGVRRPDAAIGPR